MKTKSNSKSASKKRLKQVLQTSASKIRKVLHSEKRQPTISAISVAIAALLRVRLLAREDGTLGIAGIQAYLIAVLQPLRLAVVEGGPLASLRAQQRWRTAALRRQQGVPIGINRYSALRPRDRVHRVLHVPAAQDALFASDELIRELCIFLRHATEPVAVDGTHRPAELVVAHDASVCVNVPEHLSTALLSTVALLRSTVALLTIPERNLLAPMTADRRLGHFGRYLPTFSIKFQKILI